MLRIENVTKSFGERLILNNINLSIDKPGIYLLIGRNGSGKTTLFKIIKGIETPDSGSITYQIDNQVLTDKEISYVPTTLKVFNSLTVYDHLKMFCNDEERINDLVIKLDLQKVKYSKARSLSSGEKQRLNLAIALLENNSLLLLDEPTSHLDYEKSVIVLNYLKELSKDKIIIIATHYMVNANEYGNYLLTINDKECRLEELNKNDNSLHYEKHVNECNTKIVSKLFRWPFHYALMFLTVILLSLALLFININSINNYEVQEKIYGNSQYDSVIIPDSGNLDKLNTSFDDIDIEGVNVDYNEIYIPVGNFLMGKDKKGLDKCRYVITDNYDGKKLGNNEIVVMDYVFNSWCDSLDSFIYDKKDENLFSRWLDEVVSWDTFIENEVYQKGGVYALFNNTKYYIVGVIKTNLNELKKNNQLVKYFDESLNPPRVVQVPTYTIDPRYISFSEYVGDIYMNKETYTNLKKLYVDYLLNNHNFQIDDIKIYNDEEIIWGRKPENDDEAVVTTNALRAFSDYFFLYSPNPPHSHNLPDSGSIDITYNREIDYVDDNNNYKCVLKSKVKVVGVVYSLTESYVFFKNSNGIKNFLYNSIVDYHEYGISNNNLKKFDYKYLEDNKLTLGNELTYVYIDINNKLNNIKGISNVYYYILLIIGTLIFALSFVIEAFAKKSTNELIKEKAFSNKLIFNKKLKNRLIRLATIIVSLNTFYFLFYTILKGKFLENDLNINILSYNPILVIVTSIVILAVYLLFIFFDLLKIKNKKISVK